MIKEGIKKVKGEKDVSRNMAMAWTVVGKNCFRMKNGFSLKQLVFQRYLILRKLMGENNPASLERVFERYFKCIT